MKLIEIKSGKKIHYINPEYIIAIKEWVAEGTWVITLTKGDTIFIKKETLDKIIKKINNNE